MMAAFIADLRSTIDGIFFEAPQLGNIDERETSASACTERLVIDDAPWVWGPLFLCHFPVRKVNGNCLAHFLQALIYVRKAIWDADYTVVPIL